METHMRTLMLVVGLLVSLPLAAPMVVASSVHAQTQTPPGGLIPASVRTTDLAPQIPAADKSTAIVRHPDGSYETYLVPEDQLDAFIKNLGNDVLVTLIPPQSLIGHVPPQAPPPVGIVQYPVTGPQPTPPPPPQPRQRAAKTSRCGRSQGLRADANQRVAKRSSVVSHGVRLTLNMPRSTYPRDALVRMAVDLRNVSHETFVVPTPCPADNPVAQVIGRHGAVVYPPALPSEPATASSCQMQSPPEPLPPGGVIKGYSYVVLRNGIVRAAADVQLILRGISHSSATVVHLATPPVRVRLVRGHAPRITFTGPPALHAYVHGVPARDRGPLLYMDWYTCKDSQATTVGGHVTMWTPAPQSPILVPGCHQPAQWHVVAGWVGQPVAYLNYVGGFSARQE